MKLIHLVFACLVLGLSVSANDIKKRRAVPKLPEKPKVEDSVVPTLLERVDPHGKKEITLSLTEVKNTNACLVCHSVNDDKLVSKPLKNETCFNCHNHAPHSGIEEHLKNKVSCVDCHAVHRSQGLTFEKSNSSFFSKPYQKNLDEGLQFQKTSKAMLKKTCTDCHKL